MAQVWGSGAGPAHPNTYDHPRVQHIFAFRAQAELSTIFAQLAQEYPATNKAETARLVPLTEEVVGPYRSALFILLAAVGAVLLIACSNVANLMLSRTSGRRREIAIRAALGASRFRLARQLFAESLLLAVAGGLTGLMLASWGVDALRALAPGDIPRLAQSGLTRAVGVFGFVATIVTVILFGTAPVIRLGDFQQSEALRESSRAHSAGRESRRFRGVLVISQIAMALFLQLILRGQTKLLLAGVGIGLTGSLASMRFVSGLLFGVDSGDLASIAISMAVISAAALLAAYLPARRAARLDPIVVLRED